jgi:hypothetical protein
VSGRMFLSGRIGKVRLTETSVRVSNKKVNYKFPIPERTFPTSQRAQFF